MAPGIARAATTKESPDLAKLAADGKPLEATPALEARPTRDLIARLRRSIAVT